MTKPNLAVNWTASTLRVPAASYFFYVRSEMLRMPMLIGLIHAASISQAQVDPLADLTKGQPKDVASVVERIVTCTHLAGEEPYDATRRRELATAMKRYRCDKLYKDEIVLRKRYKDNTDVLGVLQKAHEW